MYSAISFSIIRDLRLISFAIMIEIWTGERTGLG